jgi:hypothetical protein
MGEDTTLTIDILARSHPHQRDYWDGNWLDSQRKIGIPGFNAKLRLPCVPMNYKIF